MKFIATTSDKIASIAKVAGQLIFSRDDRVIYLDTDISTRTEYRTIIMLTNEAHRQGIVSPVNGFYFVEETAIFWYYEASKGWEQLTKIPDERINFYDSISELPEEGTTRALYIIPSAIYQWDDISSSYIKLGGDIWEPIA